MVFVFDVDGGGFVDVVSKYEAQKKNPIEFTNYEYRPAWYALENFVLDLFFTPLLIESGSGL